jgi:hypothetical protein
MRPNTRGRRVEGQRVEVRLSLLDIRLTRSPFLISRRHQGPTVSSASVTVVISGPAGSAAGSVMRGSMITLLVSSTPRR